jgi:hypothetical protein
MKISKPSALPETVRPIDVMARFDRLLKAMSPPPPETNQPNAQAASRKKGVKHGKPG